MSKLTDSALGTIDRFSHKLGPVNSLLNEIVDRFIPKATAQACSGIKCNSGSCVVKTCGPYGVAWHVPYATSQANCKAFNYSCVVYTCGVC